ncbi:hypothetical protein ElyMa_003679000 [Elysia marginata]|uniref:Uncharacterized protein n=1 Tax=Elysia marginata TaxID=1093978 RepID=A0AAV4EZW8_9GAST|nr:hypothetical protein ElyMa_003679000 [Elysia marginata]
MQSDLESAFALADSAQRLLRGGTHHELPIHRAMLTHWTYLLPSTCTCLSLPRIQITFSNRPTKRLYPVNLSPKHRLSPAPRGMPSGRRSYLSRLNTGKGSTVTRPGSGGGLAAQRCERSPNRLDEPSQ